MPPEFPILIDISAQLFSVRLPGSGGGNDISSLTQVIVAMKHERRRLVDKVDFITSPGFLNGRTSRSDSGLVAGGMYRVVTDLAILGFDAETGSMKVEALHPGVTPGQVQDHTGFELFIDPDTRTTQPPSAEELAVLHELDPDRLYTA